MKNKKVLSAILVADETDGDLGLSLYTVCSNFSAGYD
jgi:hypothetical protein